MNTRAARRLVGGTILGITTGAAALGLASPAAHADTTTQVTATAKPSKPAPLTESQANQLAIQLLESYLKPESVVLGASGGADTVTVATDDAADQHGAHVTASWAPGTAPSRPCTDDNLCTATTLPNGTLYQYWALDMGYEFSYVRTDGMVLNIQDVGGYWTNLGATQWWPIDENTMATAVQDPRWNQVFSAVPDPKTKTPKPGKLTPVQLAQQTVTAYLSPYAHVASTTSTATSVTATTSGGVPDGATTTVTWMTQGTGANQYDRQRDCLSKTDDWFTGAYETSFGTGTLCTVGVHGNPVHDFYYTRSDGKVLWVHNVDGSYNGRSGEFQPVPNASVEKLLLDPRWDTVMASLA